MCLWQVINYRLLARKVNAAKIPYDNNVKLVGMERVVPLGDFAGLKTEPLYP